MTGLLLFVNWMSNSYDSILVIINRLTKIVYYKLVQVTVNALGLAKVISDMVMQHHNLLDSIISDSRAIIILKF